MTLQWFRMEYSRITIRFMDKILAWLTRFAALFIYLQTPALLQNVICISPEMFLGNDPNPSQDLVQNVSHEFLANKNTTMGQGASDFNQTKPSLLGGTGGGQNVLSEGAAWPPKSMRFVKVSPVSQGRWMDSSQVLALIESGEGFMDLTDAMSGFLAHGRSGKLPVASQKIKNKTFPIPKEMRHSQVVQKHIGKIQVPKMKKFIQDLSDFYTRFYWTEEGEKASVWLQAYAKELIAHYTGDTFVYTFTKKDPWRQKSVFVRMEGKGSLSGETIIFSSHLDSVNVECVRDIRKPCDGKRSPGADDNGTGSSVLMEVLRIFVELNFVPKRTLEWHWYTAEEVGSRGSLSVAIEYWRKKKNVVGVLNIDSVGWGPTKAKRKVGLQTVGVYEPLVELLRTLTDKYLSIPWKDNDMCPHCTSDFASWTELGYPACHTSEVELNPYLHTLNDTMGNINFNYVKEFAKLALAFGIEYGEPYVGDDDDR